MFKYIRNEYRLKSDPISYARSRGVAVGKNCRFLGTVRGTFGSEPYLVSIGNHVTLTSGVKFITHDGGVWVFREKFPDLDVFGPISIGDNVFIGIDSIIMPGVSIGNNCVVGAGSIVTRNVESNMVVAGIPARALCTLEDYWERVRANASHIRSLPDDEKKKRVIEKFQ